MSENNGLEVKYPQIELQLIGLDGNAFSILGRASSAMKRAQLSKEQRDEFMSEAMAGDYDHLLQTCAKYFTIS